MNAKVRTTRNAVLAATVAAALFGIPQISFAAPLAFGAGAAPQAQGENPAAGDAASRLNKKEFRNVKVSVDSNGIATLSGTVDLYEYKADADKRVHKAKGVTAVRNDIEVAGPTVPDGQLKAKLVEKLTYDRVGYGNVFDAISVDVQNGVVTLAGHALDYPSKDSALGLVSTYPGVKEVVDNIQVDPASPMDDRIRMAEYRAIYGFPSLNKYAIDPAKTIRITVQNGNVQLDGVVDSQADKDTAGIRANGVSGVFSVKNYLQVANQPSERQSSASNQ
ncbi:MAG: BON domain-containing protein [Terracidiphilus sp.]|jgi:osmotically-inducible protein OsmY